MTPEGIEDLISRVALGDRGAFSELYDATSAKLFGVCLRVLRQRAAAEDAMQDAYIKVWKNAGRYSVNGLSPMTWLITIARNTAIDRHRAQKQTADLDDYSDTLPAPGPSPEQAAIARSDGARIAACLEELKREHCDAIKGAYLDGETYADLAARFSVPLNTMRTWLRRSLISVRECMSR